MAAALTFAIDVELDAGGRGLAEALARYPCLLATPIDSGFVLQGTFPVLHEQVEIDAFAISIELHRRGAVFAAALREIGGRIPRTEDRHIFGTHGFACVALPEDIYLQTHGKPLSLIAFLDGPVRSFLLAQVVMEREGHWPFGERGHGTEGLADFYEELLGTRDLHLAARYLGILTYPRTHRQWRCPCGSGEKLRRCHAADVASLRSRLSPQIAGRFLERVRSALLQSS